MIWIPIRIGHTWKVKISIQNLAALRHLSKQHQDDSSPPLDPAKCDYYAAFACESTDYLISLSLELLRYGEANCDGVKQESWRPEGCRKVSIVLPGCKTEDADETSCNVQD